ncbi:hypothetical protein IV487_00225 [Enterococcus saccharolyticus]|uniref:Uncharacterized protein n=1 Tax=Candidatus Enterococcus willemsii TaxID=1857215 RepID=A0ABQ6Z2E6_9ENTE|nr:MULTISPECIES: DUF6054 family protein [Enterococcus]KAF1305829.1 hypothetical protein BAU17_12050 [Enterococcus sp. CU12B]MCD5000900.1 hypothetical protein [Enterococcus saccharolyticus]
MAKYEARVVGAFDEILSYLHQELEKGSMTLSLEEESYIELGETKIAIRAYERYSWFGQSRVSLHLTLVSNGQSTVVSAISTGGSQAALLKVNTLSESSFLDSIIPAIEKIKE